jgi:hypothetical protein
MPWHTHLHSHGALSCVLFICWSTLAHCECSPGFYKADGPNIAVNKPAFASSSLESNYGAWRAFDGYSYGFTWNSEMTMSLQWVGVDLQSSLTIKSIRFYPSPGEITGRPDTYIVRVGQSSSFTSNPACASRYLSQEQPYFDFSCVATGQYVSLHKQSGGPMVVYELEVYKGGDCTQCVAGKFKEASGSAACDDCAAGKYSSVTGRTTVCDNCLAGTYSTLTGQSSSATCQNCLAGTYSTLTGQSSSATCQNCLAGTYSTLTGQSSSATCQNCLAGTYSTLTGQSSSASCQNCPALSTSPAGSTALTQCTCNSGYVADTSTTPFTCKVILCAAGSTGPAGSCTQCVPGKYKAASGSAPCDDCVPGKYSTSTGATLEAACLVCPSDTNSPSGSATLSNCSCNTGYFGPNGGPCTFSYINFARQCASGDCTVTGISELLWPEDGSYRKLSRLVDGQFIENRGAQTNTGQNDWLMIDLGQKRSVSFIRIYNRPDATWYLDNFQIRIGDSSTFANNPACVTGERQFEYVKDFSCVLTGRYVSIQQFTGYHMAVNEMEVYGFVPCNAGFTGPGGGSCAACAAGKYKTTTGSAACTDCGAGKYSTSTGATSSDVCTNCGAGKYSTSSTSTTCQDCLAGKYSTDGSSTCQNCNAGSYASLVGSSVCTLCPAFSTSSAGSVNITSCECNVGYWGTASSCTACTAGQYKSTTGSAACLACLAGKFASTSGRSSCQNCNAGTYASLTGSSVCTLCPANTYQEFTGMVECTMVPYGATSPAGSTSITSAMCTLPNFYVAGRMYQSNMYGPLAVGDRCTSFYSTSNGYQICGLPAPFARGDYIEGCPAGYSQHGHSQTYTFVEDYLDGTQRISVKTWVFIITHSAGSGHPFCQQCNSMGKLFKEESGCGSTMGLCIACPYESTVLGVPTSRFNCSCPTGKVLTMITYAINKVSTRCACKPGSVQSRLESGSSSQFDCLRCPANTYSPANYLDITCTACPAFSSSPAESVKTDCTCNQGYTGQNGGLCTACIAGTYKNTTGSTVCTPCPSNTTSITATTSITGCICNSGYEGPSGGPCTAKACNTGYTGPAGSCVACLGGTYKNTVGSEACTSCPRNSSSPSGSSALTACQCNAGFSGANGGTCSACGAGSYKATVGSVACTLCGANTYSTSNASISATSCLACPGNSTSVAGSSVCQCKSGYSGPDGGPCEACSVGFYKTTAGAANCTRCPENAVSALASTTLASCKCDAGHSGPDGGQCTACAAGSYKPTVGSVACTLCGVNTYGTTLGAISNTSCVGCPGNSTSVRGSDKPELCFCKAGYEQTKEFDSCIECRPGFYDNITNRHECSICGGGLYSASWGASGPETCKECGPGTWSDIGSATCSLCPPNSNSSARSTSLTDCKCIPGFTGQDGQTCEACERGEYKASVGNASCTICSENSYSARGTDLYSELTDRGGTRCMCLFGYTGPDSGNCTACEEGKYKNVSGSTLCYNCARNSTSPAGSSQKSACVCNAGYEETISGSEENELNCTACARGKYKATISFKYLQILLNPCSSCPANFTTISGSAASGCECDVGYSNSSTNTTSQNWCGSCKIGTYKNSTGNISWAYGRSASDGCVVDDGCCQCPQNRTTLSVATVESVECLCMRGFGGSGCKVCSAGKYKENISMGECVSCPFGSTTVDMGSSAASHCVAARGHYGNLTVGFTACANGSYAPRTGMQQCIPCPPGATSPLGAVSDVLCVCELTGWTRSLANTSDLCSCREGFARNPVTRQCELCKANYSCAGGDLPAQPCPNASVSPSGSANTTDCVCMAGYSGVDGGPCVGCGKGEWKAVNGSSQCIKCVNNTMSVERSTSVKSCLCKPGYTGEDGGPCTACELGSYKEEEGAFVCRNCTANTTTLERGSSKYLNCLCNSGFELSSSSDNQNTTICAACAVGKYKQTPGLPQVCLSCPDYKTTLRVGSMVQSECVCVPGWFSAFNSSSCQMCAENSFKASTGNEPCTLCFPHAISPAGSNTSSACQCVQGFTGPNGGACAQCMPGQYKTVIGSSQCLQCVANSISPAGSTNATECVCNAGFVGQLGGPCSACPRDTYALKNTVSATGVCMPCPAYSKSEPQSSSLTSCKCLPGYEGTAGGPCTPCGLGYYRESNDATCRQCPRYTNTTSLIAQSAAECKGTPGYVTGVVKMPSVNITTRLPYSFEQFTDDAQAKIKKSIAASAQAVCECVVNEEDVTILDVKLISEETAVSSSATRRLLQASGAQLQITHSIEVDTIDDVEEILNSMTVSMLNEELKAQGLNGSTYNISKVPNIEDIVYATPCPKNTYKNSLGNNSCSSCPPQSSAPSGSSSIDACKCEGNLMKNRQGFCDRECAAGFEARTSMDVGGQMVTACAPCLKSFYKASAGSQDCTRCPPNSFSLLYNQTSVTSCMCEQGYIWNSVSNLCDACPPGTSNNNYNESVCYLCNTTCPADVL